MAWIWIPGTNIDYPVVQSHDNEIYLYKDFEGNSSPTGSIFLDFESQSDLRGQNNILYGHHMKNGSMSLRQTRFHDDESFQQFVQEIIKPCEYAKLPASPVKRLYTLVTCSYEVEDGRTVLFAVEV